MGRDIKGLYIKRESMKIIKKGETVYSGIARLS